MTKDKVGTVLKPPDQVIAYYLMEIGRAETYVSFSERFLKEEHDTYLKSLDDEEAAKRYDYRTDLSADLDDSFPQLQRTSCLLVLFSTFEENLDHLCWSLEQHRKLNLKLHDLAGRGIDRSRAYLSKVAGWKLPTSNWEKLKDVQRIRNLFSHASGYIPKTDLEDISRVVKRSQFLSIQSLARDRILVKAGYLEHFLSLIKSYFRDLGTANAPLPAAPRGN
jgi:hypothetical protein